MHLGGRGGVVVVVDGDGEVVVEVVEGVVVAG